MAQKMSKPQDFTKRLQSGCGFFGKLLFRG